LNSLDFISRRKDKGEIANSSKDPFCWLFHRNMLRRKVNIPEIWSKFHDMDDEEKSLK